MELNEDRISGHFLGNVLRRALPAALADYLLVLGVMLFYLAFHLEDDMLSTISTGVMGVVNCMMVFRTSKPFNTLRIVMMSFLIAAFAVCYFFFPRILRSSRSTRAVCWCSLSLRCWPARSSGRCAALASGSPRRSCTQTQTIPRTQKRRAPP